MEGLAQPTSLEVMMRNKISNSRKLNLGQKKMSITPRASQKPEQNKYCEKLFICKYFHDINRYNNQSAWTIT